MRLPSYALFKRAMDVVIALVVGFISLPVLVVVAFLIRVKLGSPVLFRQDRPGLDGETFTLVKFRSMKTGDGSDEERIGNFGKALRSTSLDELPELWNVVRGDMSLVGPRPLLIDYLPVYTKEQARRHQVRPGLTGLAQVEGRNSLEWPDRLALDVHYVDNCSLALDFSILRKTVTTTLKREDTTGSGLAVGTIRFDDYVQQRTEAPLDQAPSESKPR